MSVALLALVVAAPYSLAQQPAEPPVDPAMQEPGDLGRVSDISELSLEALLNATITTASRMVERATEAPATVYVITKQDIRARGYSTLADVLKDLPGMETVEQYYSEQGTLVPVRGVVGNNKIALLINGMRVNPPGGEELMIRDDVSVRHAEQIEVVYGPGSTLYGQDAISAVINIKTRRPSETRVEALGAYGNFDSREGFLGLSLRLREQAETPLLLTAFASARSSDLANLRKAYPVWYENHQRVLAPMGRSGDPVREDTGYNLFGRIESSSASLQAWFRDSRRSSAEGSGEGGVTPVLYFVEESKWRDRSLVVEGQHTLRLAPSVALHSILTFNRYEVHPETRYVFPDGLGGLFLDDFKYGVGSGMSVEEKVDWALGPGTRLMFGVVASNYDIVPKATVLGGANPDDGIVSQAGALRYYRVMNDLSPDSAEDVNRAVDLHYQQYGAYAEGSHHFTDHFRVIAGVRVDVNSRYGEIPISPRAALIFNALNERLTLKYLFSQAYVAPAPYFAYNVFQNSVQISRGNPGLEPEKAMSNELNATWQDGHLLASASAYFNRQSNLLLTAQSEAAATMLGTVWVGPMADQPLQLRQSINEGTSNALGFDLFTRLNLQPVSVWASYSFIDFSRTVQGITTGLPQVSAHNVRLGVTWNIFDGLSVTPSFVYRSTPENLSDINYRYSGVGVSLSNPYELNLAALYSPVEFLDVFVTGRNLTNRKYALRGVSGPAPQEPLTVMSGLRARY